MEEKVSEHGEKRPTSEYGSWGRGEREGDVDEDNTWK